MKLPLRLVFGLSLLQCALTSRREKGGPSQQSANAEEVGPSSAVLGINFGSTYSTAAIQLNGRVKLLADSSGLTKIPSCVTFDNDGQTFIPKDPMDCIDGVTGIKSILGRHFHSREVQRFIQRSHFQVLNDNDKPIIRVPYGSREGDYSPEELVAIIFAKFKHMAEAQLGRVVTRAALAVPESFDSARALAIRRAASMAGLDVVQLVDNSVASIAAYEVDQTIDDTANVLVVHIGGQTTSASLYRVGNGVFALLEHTYDPYLGGEDFSGRLIDHLLARYEATHEMRLPHNLPLTSPLLLEIRRGAEEVKEILSAEEEAVVQFEVGPRARDKFSEMVTRSRFEEVNRDLFDAVINVIEDTIATANMTRYDIDKIVLVGGSSQIPKIREMIRDLFEGKGKQLIYKSGQQTASAIGAMLVGTSLLKDKIKHRNWSRFDEQLPQVRSRPPGSLHNSGRTGPGTGKVGSDTTMGTKLPHPGLRMLHVPLAIESSGGLVTMVPSGSNIPTRKYQVFATTYDGQDSMALVIYLGSKRQVYLGTLTVRGIRPAPRGVEKIGVTFSISADHVLDVTARRLSGGFQRETENLSLAGWRNAAEAVPRERIENIDLADLSSLVGTVRTAMSNVNEDWNIDPRGDKWSDVRAAQAQVARLDRWVEELGPGASRSSRLAKWEELTELIASGSVVLGLPPAEDEQPHYERYRRRFHDEL